MKSEVLIFLALAAALAFHRNSEGSACGPGGCLFLPPDFVREVEAARVNAALPVVAPVSENR